MTILLLISVSTKGQTIDSLKVKTATPQKNYSSLFNTYNPFWAFPASSSKKISTNLGNPFAHWGFMCIGEYKLEQKTGIPLKFRLGSLDYVNKLEGKQ